MDLTNDEKEMIRNLLIKKLEDFKNQEVTSETRLALLKGEREFEIFLEQLITKFS